jgi:hypothetical protein
MTAPFTQTVTLVRRTKGGRTASATTRSPRPPARCRPSWRCAPAPSSHPGRESLSERLSVYLPAGTALSYLDAVLVAGERWEVDGDPTAYTHALTGWTPGVEVGLRRVRMKWKWDYKGFGALLCGPEMQGLMEGRADKVAAAARGHRAHRRRRARRPLPGQV